MAKHLNQIIQELGIDKPVMATKVVGNRVELHLYGGEVLNYPPIDDVGAAATSPPTPTNVGVPAVDLVAFTNQLEALTVKSLRELAKGEGIEGYGKMRKAELIEALLAS